MNRLVLMLIVAHACAAAQHRYPVSGMVLSLDQDHQSMIVSHSSIPGYMDAMTMDYSVDEEGVLKTLHSGDDFRAVVYPDDLTLHQVQVVARSSEKKRIVRPTGR